MNHSIVKVGLVSSILCAGILLVLVTQAHAADAPQFKDPNCPTMAEVEALVAAQGGTSVELDAKSLLGVTVKQGGKILVANIGGKVVAIAPVIDGCVQPPTGVGEIIPDKGA